jgi:UPF0042 nucleotide-binding protein
MNPSRLVILSGMSGSGKSAAVKCFEDMGYFCVDNLPSKLIPVFLDLFLRSREAPQAVALVIDIREGTFLRDFPKILQDLREAIPSVEVLFFEATDEVLARRFSETRRPHPMPGAASVEEGITREREALRELRQRSDRILDTSKFNVHELKAHLFERFSGENREVSLAVKAVSFGYKHGLPGDADLVFDVRFLPNPFFVPGLRDKSGLDREVRSYLEGIGEYRTFCSKMEDLLGFLLPQYVQEGKAYLTVACGCTGGRHRSVALAEFLGGMLRAQGFRVRIDHRDVGKDA